VNAGIKDVAAEAGVSVGTVSNVLNRPDIVAAVTRDRVQAVIDRLGFVRNESARQLRAGRSRSIGLVVLDIANPFFTDVARGAEAVADAKETIVMLCNIGGQPQRELRHLEMLEQQRVLGVLITPVNTKSPRIDAMISRGLPVVLVDRRAPRRRCCSVSVDDVLGGELAAAHLLGQGHRRIAFVGGPMSIQQVQERRQGAEQALGDAVGDLLVLETDSLSASAGRQAAEQLAALPASRRPTGVFCANDLIALGLLQELVRRDLRVPEDIAVVGYDDIDNAAVAVVPLSSVRQPRELLGRTAAELLFQEIDEGTGHRHRQVVFEPELVVRASSDLRRGRKRPATGGTHTAAAAPQAS
jgi:LacI family transcriptional regulator